MRHTLPQRTNLLRVVLCLLTAGAWLAADAGAADTVTLFVPGLLRRLRLHVVAPPVDRPGQTLPIVVALPPGAGGPTEVAGCLKKYWEKEALKRKFVVVCPEMRGQDFGKAAFRLLPIVISHAVRRCHGDRKRVFIAGNSNGGAGAYMCFMRHPDRFIGLIVFPGCPTGRVEAPGDLTGKQAYVLVGENDKEWLRASKQVVSALRTVGVSVTFEVVPGQGHALDIPPAKLFDWMERVIGAE